MLARHRSCFSLTILKYGRAKKYISNNTGTELDAAIGKVLNIEETLSGTEATIPSSAAVPSATEAHPCYALVGTTAERPWNVPVGHNYFDTTLGKEIFVKERPAGTNAPVWVDATGTPV